MVHNRNDKVHRLQTLLIPEQKAAIELVSGSPSGVLTTPNLFRGSTHVLEFMMGDANNSCVGEFIVYAQVGNLIQNFTLRSNGTGSVQRFSMKFKAEFKLTSISFVSFNET